MMRLSTTINKSLYEEVILDDIKPFYVKIGLSECIMDLLVVAKLINYEISIFTTDERINGSSYEKRVTKNVILLKCEDKVIEIQFTLIGNFNRERFLDDVYVFHNLEKSPLTWISGVYNFDGDAIFNTCRGHKSGSLSKQILMFQKLREFILNNIPDEKSQ